MLAEFGGRWRRAENPAGLAGAFRRMDVYVGIRHIRRKARYPRFSALPVVVRQLPALALGYPAIVTMRFLPEKHGVNRPVSAV